MATKQQLEEQSIKVTKEIQDLIFEHYMKLKDLVEKQSLIRLKLEKGKRGNKI